MATVRTQPRPVAVTCPSCGDTRLVSPGQARRFEDALGVSAAGAAEAAWPSSTMPRWLEAFTNEDLVLLARSVWNTRGGSVEAVRRHRSRLGVPEPGRRSAGRERA